MEVHSPSASFGCKLNNRLAISSCYERNRHPSKIKTFKLQNKRHMNWYLATQQYLLKWCLLEKILKMRHYSRCSKTGTAVFFNWRIYRLLKTDTNPYHCYRTNRFPNPKVQWWAIRQKLLIPKAVAFTWELNVMAYNCYSPAMNTYWNFGDAGLLAKIWNSICGSVTWIKKKNELSYLLSCTGRNLAFDTSEVSSTGGDNVVVC